jgi:hypothetical protein
LTDTSSSDFRDIFPYCNADTCRYFWTRRAWEIDGCITIKLGYANAKVRPL